MPVDPDALTRTLRGLQHVESSSGALPNVLHEVVIAAAHLFDVQGAGLMLVDDGQVLCFVAASNEQAQLLEDTQELLGIGPCVDALVFGVTVAAADISQEARWADLADEIVPKGVRSVLGLPVHVAGSAVGTLNLFRGDVHDWEVADIDGFSAFLRIVENVLGSAIAAHRQGELIDQLQHALDHRVTIERAVGIVMARQGVDPVGAFNQLRTIARTGRRRVADVALELVNEISSASPPP